MQKQEDEIEIEAKFYQPHLSEIRERLLGMGAILISERTFEINWRFDSSTHALTSAGKVLRLREDNRIRLTYKSAIISPETRKEIEIEVDNSQRVIGLLGALGYQVVATYEKYRETFSWKSTEIVLDELPFGFFLEVEGPSIEKIRKTVEDLGIDWNMRISLSYLEIFERLKRKLQLSFADASFENFAEIEHIHADDLDLQVSPELHHPRSEFDERSD